MKCLMYPEEKYILFGIKDMEHDITDIESFAKVLNENAEKIKYLIIFPERDIETSISNFKKMVVSKIEEFESIKIFYGLLGKCEFDVEKIKQIQINLRLKFLD